MRTVVAIYTGQGLADPLRAVVTEMIPDCRLVNIIDDGLIHDVNAAGEVTPAIVRRLLGYYRTAEEMGADVILNTCSSVGEIVDIGRQIVGVPIVRIDEPMATEAAARYRRVGVIATLPSTLAPTRDLILSKARELGRSVTVVDGLAEGAFAALIGGDAARHDELIAEAARGLTDVEAIVLAQASMARMRKELARLTGKPVLASPVPGVAAVKSLLEVR